MPDTLTSAGGVLARARAAVSTAIAATRMARSTGLLGAVSPRAAVQFARDALARGTVGGAMVLHLHALEDAHRMAIVSPTARLSYGDLDRRINLLAHGLRRRGVGRGDRVALLLPNGHEYLELNGCLNYLGGIAVQIGYRLKPPEVAYILRNSGARALVFHAEYRATVEAALAEPGVAVPRDACISVGSAPGFTPYDDLLATGEDDAPPRLGTGASGYGGVMVYTSGTTGRPKGARRELGQSGFETVFNFMRSIPLRRDERHLVVCPLYHSAAPAFVALVFGVGGCVVVLDHFEPEAVLRTIERERITSTMMVPTMYARLVDLGLPTLRRYDLSSLRWMVSGAAPLPAELARRIEESFGPVLWNFYGATETGFVTLAGPGEHTARPGTIGRVIAGNELRLLDESGRDVPDGEVGELYVRSAMLMQGYHADDEATRKATRDGFISVGDMARRDADGFYYLADRKADMVISGGVNIYPLEIEQRLIEHPAVSEAAVVGVADAQWGESLAAFVVLRPGMTATEEELRAFVGEALADYKRPKRVTFVDDLPRTPTGKVLKRELRTRASAPSPSKETRVEAAAPSSDEAEGASTKGGGKGRRGGGKGEGGQRATKGQRPA